MTKKLDVDAITSDLEGSAFFPQRKNDPVLSGHAPITELASVPVTPVREVPPVRPNERAVVREAPKRIITRNSFETYEDQMDSLREIAYLEKREGKVGSMSAMVREAIDDFLVKKKRTLSK
ncbi:hypothetical protein [Streptomyces sp. NPDC056632]|uniref:hypothetical protein n=1 Tax=Streptomyces sp. NPDC056632 TaxID=3345884 RepID=UPI0036AB3CEC